MNSGFEINYETNNDCLYAFVSGESDSLEITIKYWQKVIKECERKKLKKLIVNEDFKNQVTTIDMYKAVEAITKMVHSAIKIAFVDVNAEHLELNKFGETVARNRGMHVKVFSHQKDAEEWLKYIPEN